MVLGDSGIPWFQIVRNFLGHHLQFHLSDCAPSPHPLPGTNVHEAQSILSNSGLPITSAADLEDAAKKAVASVAEKWCLCPDPLEEEVHLPIKSNGFLITVKKMVIPLGKKQRRKEQESLYKKLQSVFSWISKQPK